jgi:hypothetical protein
MPKTRLQGAWLVAGLAMLGAMAAGTGELRAGTISTGIGVGKGGDPFYTYDIYVYLNANQTLPKSTLLNPVSLDLTFSGMTGLVSNGVDTTQVLVQDPAFGITNWNPIISTNQLEFQESNALSVVGPYATQHLLYEVQIKTPDTPTQTGLTPGTIIQYTYTIPGQGTQTGTVTVFSIPEPSTIIMAAMGAAALPFVVIRGRRRRARGVA